MLSTADHFTCLAHKATIANPDPDHQAGAAWWGHLFEKLGGPGRIPNAVVDRVTARLLSQHDFVLAKHNNPPVKSTHKQNIKSVNTLQYQEFESRHYTHWKSFFKLLGWRPSIYLIFVFYLNFGQLKIITPFAHPEW